MPESRSCISIHENNIAVNNKRYNVNVRVKENITTPTAKQRGFNPPLQCTRFVLPHGGSGSCSKISHKVSPSKKGVTPPSMHHFFHCFCYNQKLIDLMNSSIAYNGKRVPSTCDSNFMACKTFYGEFGTGEDNVNFCQCLWNRETTLWYIEREINGRNVLILPKEALDEDIVYVDFTKIKLFAIRHALRDLIENIMREKKIETFHALQEKLKMYDNLFLEKSTRHLMTKMTYKKFHEVLLAEGPIVPRKSLKLQKCARGKSKAVVILKDGKETMPYWISSLKMLKELPVKLGFTQEKMECLKNPLYEATSKDEKKYIKMRNLMPACFEPRNIDFCGSRTIVKCKNYQTTEKPGICWECLLEKFEWSYHEEVTYGKGIKWQRKYQNYLKSHPECSEIEFECLGNPRPLYVGTKYKGKGHFHSQAVAIRLIDFEMSKLKDAYAHSWNIETLYPLITKLINQLNESGQPIPKPIDGPGHHSIKSEHFKLFAKEDSSFFYLNIVSSFVHAVTHFSSLSTPYVEQPNFCKLVRNGNQFTFSSPLYVQSLCYHRRKHRGVKRSIRGQRVKEFIHVSVEEFWIRPEISSLPYRGVIINNISILLTDLHFDIFSHVFFVAVTNGLFTAFVPEDLGMSMFNSPTRPTQEVSRAQRGDWITFDGKVIYWLHYDDMFLTFAGGFLVGRTSSSRVDLPVICHHTPDRIYFLDGSIRSWSFESYFYDVNGVLLLGDNSLLEKVVVKTRPLPDFVPFGLKLLFLSMDHRFNHTVLHDCLQSPSLYVKTDSEYDLKNTVKDKLRILGYNIFEASKFYNKSSFVSKRYSSTNTLPYSQRIHENVQKMYLSCAVSHSIINKSCTYLHMKYLLNIIPNSQSSLLKITCENDEIIGKFAMETHEPIKFYPRCRKVDTSTYFTYNNNIYDFFKPFLEDSKIQYLKGKRIFPCLPFYDEDSSMRLVNTCHSDLTSDALTVATFSYIPCVKYTKQMISFADLVKREKIPSKVRLQIEDKVEEIAGVEVSKVDFLVDINFDDDI